MPAPDQPFAVILPAAGSGSRFGGDKLRTSIAGRSVLEWSLRAFLDRPDVAHVVVVRSGDEPLPLAPALLEHSRLHRCPGGSCRAQSVRCGLEWLETLASPAGFIAVHDAARPAVSQALIDRVFALARTHGAAVPGVAVSDTIKQIRDGRVVHTLPRAELVAVQTPQVMRRDWLRDAFARCPVPLEQITDDVQLLELADYPVHLAPGAPTNRKLTHPADVAELEARLSSEK